MKLKLSKEFVFNQVYKIGGGEGTGFLVVHQKHKRAKYSNS